MTSPNRDKLSILLRRAASTSKMPCIWRAQRSSRGHAVCGDHRLWTRLGGTGRHGAVRDRCAWCGTQSAIGSGTAGQRRRHLADGIVRSRSARSATLPDRPAARTSSRSRYTAISVGKAPTWLEFCCQVDVWSRAGTHGISYELELIVFFFGVWHVLPSSAIA